MKTTTTWRPPTRRAFVAMLGLGGAALALVKATPKRDSRKTLGPPEQTKPLWIGHC